MTQASFSGGHFAFQIDGGESIGYISKVDGGVPEGDDVAQKMGPNLLARKSVSNFKYTDITIEAGMGMTKGFYDWMNLYFKRQFETKTGIIHACNAKFESMAMLELINTHISEVSLPKLSGDSKDPCKMTIKLSPEEVHYKKGDGKVVSGKVGEKHKDWLAANFRVEVGGLPCDWVSEVELPKLTVKIIEHRVGSRRIAEKHPASCELSDLKLTSSMRDWDKWRDAANTTLIKGNMAMGAEMTGSVTFLDPSLKKELGRLDMTGLNIKKVGIDAAEANKESMARFTVELTVNECVFVFNESDA